MQIFPTPSQPRPSRLCSYRTHRISSAVRTRLEVADEFAPREAAEGQGQSEGRRTGVAIASLQTAKRAEITAVVIADVTDADGAVVGREGDVEVDDESADGSGGHGAGTEGDRAH